MKIFIAAGGSGGHIFPAIGLAQELKKAYKDMQLLFLVSGREQDRAMVRKEGYEVKSIPVKQMPGHLGPGYLVFLAALIRATLKSLLILGSFRPQVVVGFGGYVSGPPVFAARLLKIPTLIHEQNVVPGRANRILARWVNRIALSFEESKSFFRDKHKLVVTGNPLRPHIKDTALNLTRAQALERFSFDAANFTILVMGGSLGAQNINQVFINTLSQIEPSQRDKLQIIHLTGSCQKGTQKGTVPFWKYKAFPFLDDIGTAYKAADLLIARSGAGTIFESALFGLPAVLIPYTHAGAHQLDNAKVLAGQGGAVIIEEKALDPSHLKHTILHLIEHRQDLKTMGEKARQFASPRAGERLREEVVGLL